VTPLAMIGIAAAVILGGLALFLLVAFLQEEELP
jgi:hypothetical protein